MFSSPDPEDDACSVKGLVGQGGETKRNKKRRHR